MWTLILINEKIEIVAVSHGAIIVTKKAFSIIAGYLSFSVRGVKSTDLCYNLSIIFSKRFVLSDLIKTSLKMFIKIGVFPFVIFSMSLTVV